MELVFIVNKQRILSLTLCQQFLSEGRGQKHGISVVINTLGPPFDPPFWGSGSLNTSHSPFEVLQ